MKDKQLLLAVLAQLEREKTVSIPQLAQLLKASEEDIYEALEILVFAYDAASIRLDLHDTYASLETYGTERLLRLTATEADALVDALTSAGFAVEDDLVHKLIEAKGTLDSLGSSAEPRMQMVGIRDSSEIDQTIAAACEDDEHRLLEIAYRGVDDPHARTRIVEPKGIFSKEGHRYLQAFCHDAQDWRSFRLDRIEAARSLEECFDDNREAPAAQIAFEQGGVEARIKIGAEEPLPPWKRIRTVEKCDDGSTTVEILWTGSSWLPRHIVALMGRAIPLNPPELIDACREIVEAMAEE